MVAASHSGCLSGTDRAFSSSSLFNRMDFEDLGFVVVDWDHQLPPPAAKTVVENLPRTVISASQAGENG